MKTFSFYFGGLKKYKPIESETRKSSFRIAQKKTKRF
jgi:hypothetical protein